ncbi:MAG: twin-arginine translocase TatA/TatE family subunit [Solirubrobacteraceae bacterium]
MVGDILQPTHLLFVLIVALLVLGPKRLPEVGRTLGEGLRDFKAAINGETNHRHDEVADDYGREDSEADGHEFAHKELEATDPALPKEPTAEKHEFAYEGSDPAPTRDKPIG